MEFTGFQMRLCTQRDADNRKFLLIPCPPAVPPHLVERIENGKTNVDPMILEMKSRRGKKQEITAGCFFRDPTPTNR